MIRAYAASADNVGVFFGEDIFIAIASILLIKGFLQTNGINVQPLQLSVWAIPTAVMALVVHTIRLLLLDRHLRRQAAAAIWRPGSGCCRTYPSRIRGGVSPRRGSAGYGLATARIRRSITSCNAGVTPIRVALP